MMKFLLLVPTLALFAAQAPAQATYSKEVSRLMQAKCQGCHRAGDIAPFALTTYAEVSGRLGAIRAAVSEGRMPPWKPRPGVHAIRDSYGLADAERKTILDWIAAGAPEGDRADMAEPAAETGEWQLGEPDLVLEMPKAFEVPAGSDAYRCFVLPFEFSKQRWLSAAQVVPGNRAVVHHALLFIDVTGASAARDGADGRPGFDCFGSAGEGADEIAGAWVPGARISRLPEGIGIPMPDQGAIVMQVHYHFHDDGGHDHGKHAKHAAAPSTDRTKVGFYFTSLPPKQEMLYTGLETEEIEIPAGDKSYATGAEISVDFGGLSLLAVGPHMHLLGRNIQVEKLKPEPSQESETLIAIDNWDFNYQGFYIYESKIPLEAGSRLRLTCGYDNSEDNLRNPNQPPKVVYYGEQTTDEMCLAFLGIVLPEGFSVRSARQASRLFLRQR